MVEEDRQKKEKKGRFIDYEKGKKGKGKRTGGENHFT